MDTASRNKWQVRGVAVLIFVLGFAAGMLALGAYRAWARHAAPPDRFNQLATRLQLNADQKTKVQAIFGDTRQQLQSLRKESEPRVNDIRQQTDQKLKDVLTPDQWKQFQQMRDDMRTRRSSGAPNG
ncbi:MAG TPA: periplasmic heavy metal sensor [Pyrinomonadaceae bacterium]|jgi:DNA anti-recombination protein RmuC|nr:periplasmic heavy metal sensor [Pyrinomonadaceae bacterium]